MFGLLKTFVKGLQKPEYVVVDSAEKYEVRKYPPAKWMSTSVKNLSHKEGSSIAFRRLFKYIQGENETKQTVEMTAPVTIRVDPGEGPNCESTFTMAFYIPAEHQENPPKPTNPEVVLEERPEISVFVSQFGGFADDEKWIKNAKDLTDAIGDESKYVTEYYYTVGYDAPFKLVGRTNEIWFEEK